MFPAGVELRGLAELGGGCAGHIAREAGAFPSARVVKLWLAAWRGEGHGDVGFRALRIAGGCRRRVHLW